jgi:hypothetical protein
MTHTDTNNDDSSNPFNACFDDEDDEAVNWAGPRVACLPEMWALIAEHSGLVGAWRGGTVECS